MYKSKVAISSDDFVRGKKLFVGRETPQGMEILYSDRVEIIPEGVANLEPTLRLTDEDFQALVDAIHKDYKPSEGRFVEGKLEGTERHLQDLRQILKLK